MQECSHRPHHRVRAQEYSRYRAIIWLPGLGSYSINLVFMFLRPFFVDDGKAGGAWKMHDALSMIVKGINPYCYP